MEIIIGADAGGTQTTLVAVDMYGDVLAHRHIESINTITLDAAACHARLANALDGLLNDLGASEYHLSLGSCSLDGEADEKRQVALVGRGLRAKTIYANSDAFMTLIAATGGAPGCVLISGTGCTGLAMDAGGLVLPVAGYGWRIAEDEGSSYHLAMQAIKQVIHAFERYAPETLLTERLLERFGLKSVRDLIPRVYDDGLTVAQIAQYARDVFACARLGDAAATKLLDGMMETWLHMAGALCGFAGPAATVFGLYGGMFQHHPDLVREFRHRLKQRHPGFEVGFPSLHPALGAAFYWFIRHGKNTAAVRHKMAAYGSLPNKG